MTILIELDPATEARLTAAANARGVQVQEYAGALIREGLPTSATGTGILTPEALERMSARMSKFSEKMPVLPPEANERESYYEDRG
jgi:hypothetical protein